MKVPERCLTDWVGCRCARRVRRGKLAAMKIEVALCLPRDAATVAVVRRVTIAAIRELGVTSECIEDIQLALSEACTNVIAHSAGNDEYEVRVDIEDDLCVMRVIDSAHGFDGTALAAGFPDGDATSGRGVALMQALMDSIAFDSSLEVGTVVRLTKKLELEPGGALQRLLAAGEPS